MALGMARMRRKLIVGNWKMVGLLARNKALLDAVRQAMPQYPLDAAFEADIPAMLQECYADWRAQAG